MSENLIKSKLSETEFERCECCGMTEEYTVAYIESVRNLYAGKFICGLCSEAVKYEIFRCGKKQRRINVDEALKIHMRFCGEFVASPSPSPTVDFISAIGEMFRTRIMVVTSASSPAAPVSIKTVDGGAICAAMVIGGNGSCLHALSGGV
ncbi:hypothetical protein V5N11_010802 [Cardamine amara subsp. amara]|uniref:Uncharacterized protein n=1 Tax=Cardamine amara subsp. amara TaxID=228776 RepID=A0ABD1BP17_CARAN